MGEGKGWELLLFPGWASRSVFLRYSSAQFQSKFWFNLQEWFF